MTKIKKEKTKYIHIPVAESLVDDFKKEIQPLVEKYERFRYLQATSLELRKK